jgi:hypothetical protein
MHAYGISFLENPIDQLSVLYHKVMIPANTIKDIIILNTRIYANDLDINSASLIAWVQT